MNSTWKRALTKGTTWKIVGVSLLVLIGWLAGATLIQIGKITFAYHVLTLLLYVLHERAWNKVMWGKVPNEFKNDEE